MRDNLSSGGLRTTKAQTLISAFVIRLLKSISRLAMSEISIFYLISVAEQACLNITLLETSGLEVIKVELSRTQNKAQ